MTPNTEHKDAPVCPHCGADYDGDRFFRALEDGEEPYETEDRAHCSADCGREFIVTRHVTVTYSTRKP
jgi:hypothetical protein